MPIERIAVDRLSDDRIAEMRGIAAHYYREPVDGLVQELECGNLVYTNRTSDGRVGAFLIVNLDHHAATIGYSAHRFTYLGLGCAAGCPIVPIFEQVKSEFSGVLGHDDVGVLHLTTRTPFAYRSIRRAYGADIYPTGLAEQPARAIALARYIKSEIHRQVSHPNDDPFVLREVKKGPFTPQEVSRIGTFRGDTPIARLGVDCTGRDEVIVFHTFSN